MKFRVLEKGYLPPFKIKGIPIYVHWTFIFGGILIALFFGDYKLSSIFPLTYSYVILILVHELGHAIGARVASARVHYISIDGGGGWCYADEPDNFRQLLLFYAGGLISQFVLLIITLALITILGNPQTEGLNRVVLVFTFVNVVVLIINVIPYGENDGKKIYRLIKHRNKYS